MQEVTAKLSYLRMGPRKVRLVADLIRGRKAAQALDILSLTPKRAARPLLKLLNSAVANAKHNFSIPVEDLRISKIMVDGGPSLKRWMPKAHGRATPVRERTSHVHLVLAAMTENKKEAKKEAKGAKKKESGKSAK